MNAVGCEQVNMKPFEKWNLFQNDTYVSYEWKIKYFLGTDVYEGWLYNINKIMDKFLPQTCVLLAERSITTV